MEILLMNAGHHLIIAKRKLAQEKTSEELHVLFILLQRIPVLVKWINAYSKYIIKTIW